MQQMLRIQMIGLAIVAALVMSAVAAGSASAAHEWLLNGALLAAPVTIMSHGTLELEDTKASGGAVRVSCAGFDTGTVGPHALDLISAITAEELGTKDKVNCTFVKTGLCKSGTVPVALALNLPWHTELYLEGTEVRDMITEDGAGEPGWNVTCTNILGGTTEDDCKSPLTSTSVTNVAAGVLAAFDAKSTLAKCSVGGAGAGKVEGHDLLLSPVGDVLEFM